MPKKVEPDKKRPRNLINRDYYERQLIKNKHVLNPRNKNIIYYKLMTLHDDQLSLANAIDILIEAQIYTDEDLKNKELREELSKRVSNEK